MAIASVSVRGTPENPIFDFELPEGPAGAPGGWTMGTNLNTTDLNTVRTPGLYWNGSTVNALNPALHYPPMVDVNGSVRGLLEVKSWSGGTSVIQEYTRLGTGVPTGLHRPRVTYSRYNLNDDWTPWDATVTTRVDNTAGRVVYIWDDTTNREQLIYGDTGWRDISAEVVGYKSGKIHYRRTDWTAHLIFEGALFQNVPENRTIYLPIPGSSPPLSGYMTLGSGMGAPAAHAFQYNYSGIHQVLLNANLSLPISGYVTFPIRETWPTTLIGTPIGGIIPVA